MRLVRSALQNSQLYAVLAAFALALGTSHPMKAATYKTDWLSPAWTPCEDVGVHGTARYYYEAQQQFSSPTGSMVVNSISLYGTSASFNASDSFLTASVSVVKGSVTLKTVKLARPTDASIEPAPGPNETRRLYLPQGSSLNVPAGGTLSVAVSAAKNHCSINNSTHTLDPFESSTARQVERKPSALSLVSLSSSPQTRSVVGPCEFDPTRLEFVGDPAQQSLCLLRHVSMFGRIDPEKPSLNEDFLALVGKPPDISYAEVRRFFAKHNIEPATIGGDSDSLSLSMFCNCTPRYFLIHDVSSPNYGSQEFPADINDSSWAGNDLSRWRSDPGAHVYINRLGQSVSARDFNVPWRATKFEKALGPRTKGLFLQIELVQPRRSFPAGSNTNDALAPQPGFTSAQLDKLAQVYVIASVRAGRWLVPAFHAVIDDGIPNGHDDPQNFDLAHWISSVLALRTQMIHERSADSI